MGSLCPTCYAVPGGCDCRWGYARPRTLDDLAREEAAERERHAAEARALHDAERARFAAAVVAVRQRTLPPGVRAAIYDRWLVTDETQEAIGCDFDVAGSTVTRIVRAELAARGIDARAPLGVVRATLKAQRAGGRHAA